MICNPVVVLIDPPGFSRGLNAGIGYLCGTLRSRGCDRIHVIDFNNRPGAMERRLGVVGQAAVVGISIKTYTSAVAADIAANIRRMNPGVTLVAGGPHVTLEGAGFLQANPVFDLAVVGDGEQAFSQIVMGVPPETIPGVAWRRQNMVMLNPLDPESHLSLDELPYPDYRPFDSLPALGLSAYPLVTSRGCPYQCTYCSVGRISGRRWRSRSPENVIAEIRHAHRQYAVCNFKIIDDNFTLDVHRAKAICREMIADQLAITWSCPNGIRADRLDRELISLMRQSGCDSISIGIETLSPSVFAGVNKGEKLDDVLAAVRMIKETGLRLEAFFIIGLPGATYAVDMQTIRQARALKLDAYAWSMLVPYPGTAVWQWLKEHDGRDARILRNWREGYHIGLNPRPVFETDDYPARDRVKAYRYAYLSSMTWLDFLRIFRVLLPSGSHYRGVG